MPTADEERHAARQRAILSRTRMFRETLRQHRKDGKPGVPVFQYRQPRWTSCGDELLASGYFRCEPCVEAVQAVIREDQAGLLDREAGRPW